MPSQQQRLNLCSKDRASKESSAKASDTAPSSSPPSPPADIGGTKDQMAKDISKINALLKETSEKQDAKLNSIEASTRAMETKLTDLATRLGDAESRIAFLEDAHTMLETNPPATQAEV